MKDKKKYRYRKRIFLNEDYENTVYIVAIVENKHRSKSKNDCEARLILENPYDRVSLHFEMDMPDQVEESLTKIREFETLLRQFRKAVEKESKARKKQSYEHIKDEYVSVK